MLEEKLSATDRKLILREIKSSYVFGIVFLAFGALILMAFFGASLLHITVGHVFIMRAISIFSVYFLVTLFVWFSYFFHYIDLIKGEKIKLHVHNYKLIVKKKRTFLVSPDWKHGHHEHLEIDENILRFIDPSKPLTLELGKRSHMILFISHEEENYLDRKEEGEYLAA
ncbi:MAG: hypothetical protein ACXVC6_07500 [Bacteroidia bacterium]